MAVMVLLPGLDGTGRLFAPFQKAINAKTQVIAYPGDRFLDYDALTEYVLARLPAEPFVLVAESFAGPLAVKVAATKPPGLQAVVLTCTFVTAVLPVPLWLARRVVPWLPFRRVPTRLALGALTGTDPTPEACKEFAEILDALPDPVLQARVLATIGVNVQRALKTVAVPVLYLRGSEDFLMGRRHARRVKRLRPATRVEDVEGPHFLLQTKPAASAKGIRHFLDEAGVALAAAGMGRG